MRIRWIFLLLLFLYLPVQSQHLIESVPFKLVHQLIFIELSINDSKERLHFLFDTGAGITVLDSATAQKLNVQRTDQTSIGTSGKSIQAALTSNNVLAISENLILPNITMAIMDLSHIGKYLNTSIDGIIGNELLQNYILETNADMQQLRFYPNNTMHLVPKGSPFEIIGLESGHLGLPIDIVSKRKSNPIQLIFKIDTGAANYLTFHNEAVIKYGLLDAKKKHKTKRGFGADATITQNLSGKLVLAELNGKKWKNIPVVYEVDVLNKNMKREADGLIGQALLLDFNITYNVKAGLMYLENRK